MWACEGISLVAAAPRLAPTAPLTCPKPAVSPEPAPSLENRLSPVVFLIKVTASRAEASL